MFSENLFVLFSTKFCHHKKLFFFYLAFNLAVHQNIHGSQNFTRLIFSINLGRFEKRLRTIVHSTVCRKMKLGSY